MNKMDNLLITGGAGFIGSNFIHLLLQTSPILNIVNLDLLTYSANLENLKDLPENSNYKFIQGSICDRKLLTRIINDHNIQNIVHFAAETHVDRSILGPDKFIETNIVGTFTLLESARKCWSNKLGLVRQDVRFHHISTDEVYGSLEPDDPPFSETTLISPRSPYAASKAASDHLVRSYFHTYNMPVTITNCSNNYGPRQYPEKLIPLVILNAILGKKISIYGDGKQIRDWLFVEDHCQAVQTVISSGRPGETYNVGANNQPTNLEIINTLCSILDDYLPKSDFRPHNQLIEHVEDRPGHDRRYAINCEKINRDLGWDSVVDLKTGLEMTVKWYLENPDWMQRIIANKEYQHWLDNNYQGRKIL